MHPGLSFFATFPKGPREQRVQLCLIIGLVVLTTGCERSKKVTTFAREPLIITGELGFAPTFIGGGRRLKTLLLQNPNAVPVEVTGTTIEPFSASPEVLRVEAGETASLIITFAPLAATHFTRPVTVVDDQQRAVELVGTGEGLPTPPCPGSTFCSPVHFDPEQGACVTAPLRDDTECTSSASCFLKAVCASGECIGTLTTCDDGDPCTTDVCEASGSCGHIDGSLSCPLPVSLCEAPICKPGTGCGSVAVEDGTPCGPRLCSDAKVCISGQCVSRSVPANQACLEVVAGKPAGCGFADGQGEAARFRGSMWLGLAFDTFGNLYFADNSTVSRVSPGGEVRTIAGRPASPGFINGFGRAARFTNPEVLGFDRSGNLLIFERQPVRADAEGVT